MAGEHEGERGAARRKVIFSQPCVASSRSDLRRGARSSAWACRPAAHAEALGAPQAVARCSEERARRPRKLNESRRVEGASQG
eukprot:5854680-Pleurochrysis_carterae.AAC.1